MTVPEISLSHLIVDIEFDGGQLKTLISDDVHDGYIIGLNDPLVNKYMVTVKDNNQNYESVKTFVKGNLFSSDSILFGIWLDGAKYHVGTIRLHNLAAKCGVADVGVCIFDKNYWGQGLANRALFSVNKWVFNNLRIKEIKAGIYGDNLSSLRAFEKAGYKYSHDLDGFFEIDGQSTIVRIYKAKNQVLNIRDVKVQ